MRSCRWKNCGNPVPDGTPGAYCCIEHQLFDKPRQFVADTVPDPNQHLPSRQKVRSTPHSRFLPHVRQTH